MKYTMSDEDKIHRLTIAGMRIERGHGDQSRCGGPCDKMHNRPIVWLSDALTYSCVFNKNVTWDEVQASLRFSAGTAWCMDCAHNLLPKDAAWQANQEQIYQQKQDKRMADWVKQLQVDGPFIWSSSGGHAQSYNKATNMVTIYRHDPHQPFAVRWVFPFVLEEWAPYPNTTWAQIQAWPSFKAAERMVLEACPDYLSGRGFSSSEDMESASRAEDCRRGAWQRQMLLKHASAAEQEFLVMGVVMTKPYAWFRNLVRPEGEMP